MFRKYLQPKVLLKNTAAALLMITMSGAYYLFCCLEMQAAAKAEHCPLSKAVQTEHCNFSKNKSSETPPQTATSINLFECCNLKFNFFLAKLEKNEFPQQTPVLAKNFSGFLQSIKLENKTAYTDFSYRAPIFDSRDLRVRNCVFRI